MGIAVSNRVVARNDIGRFIRDCEVAGTRTVESAIEKGAQLSRDLAPVGLKNDTRTSHLKDSINTKMLSGNSGVWIASARHALAVEKGARPHEIPGNVSFFWENEDRFWNPGDNMIQHPGNDAQPYLRPAYVIVMREIMGIARGKYPG